MEIVETFFRNIYQISPFFNEVSMRLFISFFCVSTSGIPPSAIFFLEGTTKFVRIILIGYCYWSGCWSTRTFTNSLFGQLVPNKLVLYFSLVNSYFMPLVNSYFFIGQLVLCNWSTRTLQLVSALVNKRGN